jgi:hypothetical protein
LMRYASRWTVIFRLRLLHNDAYHFIHGPERKSREIFDIAEHIRIEDLFGREKDYDGLAAFQQVLNIVAYSSTPSAPNHQAVVSFPGHLYNV